MTRREVEAMNRRAPVIELRRCCDDLTSHPRAVEMTAPKAEVTA